MRSHRMSVLAVLSLVGLVVLGGCSDGREPMEVDNQAPITSLMTFVNLSADKFVAEVAEVPEIEQAPTRLVLELGTIEVDPTMTRSDYELVQHGVRGRLLDSRVMTNRFSIVQNIRRSRADQRMVEIAQPAELDLTQESVGPASEVGPLQYDPSVIYTLNGTFHRIGRAEEALYQFQMQLIKWDTREIVLSKTYQQVLERDD